MHRVTLLQCRYLVVKNPDNNDIILSTLGIIRANNGDEPKSNPNAVTRLGLSNETIAANGGLLFITHPDADLAPFADTVGRDDDVMRVNGNDFLGLFTDLPEDATTANEFYSNGNLVDVIGEAGVDRGWTIDPPEANQGERPEPISDDTNDFDRSVLLRWDEDDAPSNDWDTAKTQWEFKDRKKYDIFTNLLGFSPIAKKRESPVLIRAFINGDAKNKGVLLEHTGEEPAIRRDEFNLHVFSESDNQTTFLRSLSGTSDDHGNLCPQHWVLVADEDADFASSADVNISGLASAIPNEGAPIALEHFVKADAEANTVDVVGNPNEGREGLNVGTNVVLLRDTDAQLSNAGEYNSTFWSEENFDETELSTDIVTVENNGFNDLCDSTSNIFFKLYSYNGNPEQYWAITNSGPRDVPLSSIEFAISNNGYFGYQTPPFPLSDVYSDSVDPEQYALRANETLLVCDSNAQYARLCHITSSDVDTFNGNDHLALFVNNIEVDVIGEHRVDTYFSVAGAPDGRTLENSTIVRKSDVQVGNNNWQEQSGSDEESSEWVVYDPEEYTEVDFAALVDGYISAGSGQSSELKAIEAVASGIDSIKTEVSSGLDDLDDLKATIGSVNDEASAQGETISALVKYLVQQVQKNNGAQGQEATTLKGKLQSLASETQRNNGVPPFLQVCVHCTPAAYNIWNQCNADLIRFLCFACVLLYQRRPEARPLLLLQAVIAPTGATAPRLRLRLQGPTAARSLTTTTVLPFSKARWCLQSYLFPL